ncbi:hypothetical protein BLNAU_1568 [Blattamonas nauphoetae]|uniref:Uncharacterized protein n=1 Tax=Blattamonas nauphoetae TaxID=2049346 RepID=A0ABQ9YIG5_9EUKA|nr:hypothetical protein BLNAU_1568 [Blattamonas nauphoetae]
MTGLDSKLNASTDSPCRDCSGFMNLDEEKLESEHEKAVVFRSLVATVKLQPALDVSLEARAVKLLKSVNMNDVNSADAFLCSLASNSDESLARSFLAHQLHLCRIFEQLRTILCGAHFLTQSDDHRSNNGDAGLIPQLMTTLNPLSLSFAEAVDIHINVMTSIIGTVWLATPEGLEELEIEDRNEQQAVHKTVLTQVLAPSEKSIFRLSINRHLIIDGEFSFAFLILLARLLEISPYYQPTMEIVLQMPVVLTASSLPLPPFTLKTPSRWCARKRRKAGRGCVELRTGELVVVKGGRGTDGHSDTLRQSRSARRAARIVRRSAASGLADLDVDDRSDSSKWIRQRSFELSASPIDIIRAHSRLCVTGFVRWDEQLQTRWNVNCCFSRRVHPHLRSHPLHTRRVDFPLHILHHSPYPLSSSSPSTLPSLCPSWLSTRSLHAQSDRSTLAHQRSSEKMPSDGTSLSSHRLPTKCTTNTESRRLFFSECDEKEHLNFTFTRPNIVPILFLRSLHRVIRRSRCALTCHSACPRWTCCGCCFANCSVRFQCNLDLLELASVLSTSTAPISLFHSPLIRPHFHICSSQSLVALSPRWSAAVLCARFFIRPASC